MSRFHAVALLVGVGILLLGICIGSFVRPKSETRQNAYWPKDAPTEVIVSHPTDGYERTAHILNVSRIATSQDGRAPSGTWRIVLKTEKGTWYIEADQVSSQTELDNAGSTR